MTTDTEDYKTTDETQKAQKMYKIVLYNPYDGTIYDTRIYQTEKQFMTAGKKVIDRYSQYYDYEVFEAPVQWKKIKSIKKKDSR